MKPFETVRVYKVAGVAESQRFKVNERGQCGAQ